MKIAKGCVEGNNDVVRYVGSWEFCEMLSFQCELLKLVYTL